MAWTKIGENIYQDTATGAIGVLRRNKGGGLFVADTGKYTGKYKKDTTPSYKKDTQINRDIRRYNEMATDYEKEAMKIEKQKATERRLNGELSEKYKEYEDLQRHKERVARDYRNSALKLEDERQRQTMNNEFGISVKENQLKALKTAGNITTKTPEKLSNPREAVNYYLKKGEFSKADQYMKDYGLEDEKEEFVAGLNNKARADYKEYQNAMKGTGEYANLGYSQRQNKLMKQFETYKEKVNSMTPDFAHELLQGEKKSLEFAKDNLARRKKNGDTVENLSNYTRQLHEAELAVQKAESDYKNANEGIMKERKIVSDWENGAITTDIALKRFKGDKERATKIFESMGYHSPFKDSKDILPIEKMTRQQLAEYIVDDQISRGIVKEESRAMQVQGRLKGMGASKSMSKKELYLGAKDTQLAKMSLLELRKEAQKYNIDTTGLSEQKLRAKLIAIFK